MAFRTFSAVLHLPMNSVLSSPQNEPPNTLGEKKRKKKRTQDTGRTSTGMYDYQTLWRWQEIEAFTDGSAKKYQQQVRQE